MRKLMIAPSVGCCDLFHVEEQVKLINEKSDYLHMDIKDGVYVPSYGIGPDYLDYLNKHVENLKPMDAHLMVKHPQQYLETFAKAGAAYITPHTDCIEGDAFVTIHKIKELGCKAGVALSPSVPLSTIEYYLPLLDKVTIMIVDPGIAGQPVDPQMFVKINQLAKIRKERGLNFLIEADGSMNSSLYRPLYEAGADLVILGPPALWNKDTDFNKAWDIMEVSLSESLTVLREKSDLNKKSKRKLKGEEKWLTKLLSTLAQDLTACLNQNGMLRSGWLQLLHSWYAGQTVSAVPFRTFF